MGVRALALPLLAAALLVLATAASAAAAGRPSGLPGGDPLARLRAEPRLSATEAARPRSTGVAQVSLPRRTALIWLLLVSTSTLAVAIPAVQSKRPLRLAQVGVPSRERGVHMRRFADRKLERDASEEVPEEATGGAAHEPEESTAVARVAGYTGEPGPARGAGKDGGDGRGMDYADLGRHVASVLEAAREAAARIQADARSEAASTLERSKADAESALAEARRKAEELEAEAKRMHADAEKAARDVRSEADTYAEEKRADADEAASEVVARAERAARERARGAEERQRVLDENVERTEERLRRLVTGLRELAGRLDVLVDSDGLEDLADAAPGAPGAPALDDSLKRSAAAHGGSQEPEQEVAPTEREVPTA